MAFFKRPPPETESGSETGESPRPPKRRATVYDAVAGRVSQWGFIRDTPPSSRPSANQPLRPDEILFKQRNAPTRYEESDYYFAHRLLPPDQKLPSSDLLSALHAYISNFYARSDERVNQKAWKSMDETALIALGILVEENMREILGETGHLAFLEGADSEEDGDEGVVESADISQGSSESEGHGEGDSSNPEVSSSGSSYSSDGTDS
ncbi:uncharacterized protein BDR25DRAFT_215356 [Lindgomyces ingoldianus]|uniref:Uncharacterized protein n=1 Tax=Lindgomyces ingoldianus TaxID=673940 RepID=A0ACB6R7U9_9PLEO|nr:uncharacterized protein BDR25DRAFT_215356 [Lindgomyces ingoldianus]KAF2474820.1 hypothetical protein BDR25DRAFT_215356 [Lindgomyces ingoldianus]